MAGADETREIDMAYYNKLHAYINARDNVVHVINTISETPEKLVYHLKYYIDHCTEDDLPIQFSDDYKTFRVLEFFEGVISRSSMVALWQPPFRQPDPPVVVEKKELKKKTEKTITNLPSIFQ